MMLLTKHCGRSWFKKQERVQKARKGKKGYTNVPIDERRGKTNKQRIGARWVDISKQDDLNPQCGSMLIAEEIGGSPKVELHATIPPTECFRMVTSSVVDPKAARREDGGMMRLMACDVSRTHFYAFAIRFVHVKIAGEDFEPGDEQIVID